MTAFLKKHQAWLSVILLITIMPLSLTSKAESDAEKKMGLPAATPGYQQDEESDNFLELPSGTQEHHRTEDSIDVQSHPISKPRPKKNNQPIRELPGDSEENN